MLQSSVAVVWILLAKESMHGLGILQEIIQIMGKHFSIATT